MVEQARWRALGTGVHLLVSASGGDVDLDDMRVARDAVEETLARVDATYSRFRPDSELVRLNGRPAEAVPVSQLLARAIGTALLAAEMTDGLVDPAVGRLVRATGYDMDFAGLARGGAAPVVRLETVPGWRGVHLDPPGGTVRLARGIELDLGATGKAFAAELAASAAAERLGPGTGILVSLGGDVALAGTAPRSGWQVAVGDDSGADPADVDEVVAVTSGGIATSSTTVRRWCRDGRQMHHIVDPRTGAPAEGPWRTATVAAATCVDANAAATAAIILGARAPSWLEGLGLDARLVAIEARLAQAEARIAKIEEEKK